MSVNRMFVSVLSAFIRVLSCVVIASFCAGCATAETGAVGGTARIYAAARARINSEHNAARIERDTSYIFDDQTARSYALNYARRGCTPASLVDRKPGDQECNRSYGSEVMSMLQRRYFAAEPESVQEHCKAFPLTCWDLGSMEVLFREVHNRAIEKSRSDKLAVLDLWFSGKVSKLQLEQQLHFGLEPDAQEGQKTASGGAFF